MTKDKHKTFENVFDNFTIRTLFKLGSQGYFDDSTLSPVKIGKEGNIFSAKGKKGKVIIKIYRLEACDFNKMYDYIKLDPRYIGTKKKRRNVIFSWVQKEYRNLMRAREMGISVPTPYVYLNNVIVMEYIGDEEIAPMLNECYPEDPEKFFNLVVKNIKKMHKNGMVHADLSAFNILNYNEKPIFIDMPQGTVKGNNNYEEYLKRDIKNISNFFKKIGIKKDFEEIYEYVTK